MQPRLGPHPARAIALRLLAAAAVLVAAVALRELIADGEAGTNVRGSRIVDYSVDSELIGRTLPVKVVIPPGAQVGRKRGLLVFLHERGGSETSYLTTELFSGLVAQRGRAPVVAFPRGGASSYWHDREGGAWRSYLTEELVPRLIRRFGIEPERVAIGGISMGGFGALEAARRRPDLFCTAGGHSTAVWAEAFEAAPGAFDDDADFEAHDLITLLGRPGSSLQGKRIWLDVGDEDPFLATNQELAQSLRAGGAKAEARVGDGEHDTDYWNARWRRYMRFYATQIKRCAERGREAVRSAGNVDEGEELRDRP